MITDMQPEALRLADWLEKLTPVSLRRDLEPTLQASVELRRLHAANLDCMEWYKAAKSQRDELLEALKQVEHQLRWLDHPALDAARTAIAKAAGE